MPITFRQAKEILAKYYGRAGTCATDPRVDFFAMEVLQHMLIHGQYGNLRKFRFSSQKGCITVPYELEVPLKVKIDDVPGTVWDKWFEFHSTKYIDEDCIPAGVALREDPNYYPTVYEVPAGGARIGVLGTVCEAENAFLIVKGKDPTGREIITSHNGEQVVGEYLQIKQGQIQYTNATFAEITGVLKSKTIGYTTLLWIDPVRNLKGFLADYSPLEEAPSYRRFIVTTPCSNSNTRVSVLGRIRLKAAYTDTDFIPFESIHSLNLAGQEIQQKNNNALDLAKQSAQNLSDEIEAENSYKKDQSGQPMDVFQPLSGGSIQNIVGYGYGAPIGVGIGSQFFGNKCRK